MKTFVSVFFFFGLYLNLYLNPFLGQKNELNLSEDLFLGVYIILKFPGPPSFENPAYAIDCNIVLIIGFMKF